MSVLLGCVADDYTGATDLGAMLARSGMRVLLVFGLPDGETDPADSDAVIVALKSRSIPAEEATAQSLAALAALRSVGARRFFFKYCSTFDSTEEGNIGPVADALAQATGSKRVLFCPAFPENGRTVYQGHLFVHGKLLNESGMEKHPLNPMTDANLQRVLVSQTDRAVGTLTCEAVDAGPEAASRAVEQLVRSGAQFIIADTLNSQHLDTVAAVAKDDPLLTGGSAIGKSLAELIAEEQPESKSRKRLVLPEGRAAVLAGSCSLATQRQVAKMKLGSPSLQIDPAQLAAGAQTVEDIVRWAVGQPTDCSVLIYSTADWASVEATQRSLGQRAACSLLEEAMGDIAQGLVENGVRKLVVAGGETSGSVMHQLGCSSVWIGEEIAPGVPWILTRDQPRLALALKSGNFGSDDFFLEALRGSSD